MRKAIITNNGVEMMNFEMVMNKFKGLMIREMNKKFFNSTIGGYEREDLEQEGYVAMWQAFESYDITKGVQFSTHLTWQLMSKFSHIKTNASKEKRDETKIESFSLDFVNKGEGGDKDTEVSDVVGDTRIDIEATYLYGDLMQFIFKNINDFERKLLEVNLGNLNVSELAKAENTSKQNISQKNKRFKIKLQRLYMEYNSISF